MMKRAFWIFAGAGILGLVLLNGCSSLDPDDPVDRAMIIKQKVDEGDSILAKLADLSQGQGVEARVAKGKEAVALFRDASNLSPLSSKPRIHYARGLAFLGAEYLQGANNLAAQISKLQKEGKNPPEDLTERQRNYEKEGRSFLKQSNHELTYYWNYIYQHYPKPGIFYEMEANSAILGDWENAITAAQNYLQEEGAKLSERGRELVKGRIRGYQEKLLESAGGKAKGG